MSIRQKVKNIKRKIIILYFAYRRKDLPFAAKMFAVITVAYALSPIDLIPDFIPVLGYLDDVIILPLLIMLSIKLIPSDILASCEVEAEKLQSLEGYKKWYYAIPIAVIWIIIVGVIIYKILY